MPKHPKPPAKPANKVRKTVKSLPCELTQEEYLKKSERLVAVMEEISAKRKEATAIAKAFAEEVKNLGDAQRELGQILHARIEYRDVPCVIIQDVAAGVETITRLDTDELVHSRNLTQEELQVDLIAEESPDAE